MGRKVFVMLPYPVGLPDVMIEKALEWVVAEARGPIGGMVRVLAACPLTYIPRTAHLPQPRPLPSVSPPRPSSLNPAFSTCKHLCTDYACSEAT